MKSKLLITILFSLIELSSFAQHRIYDQTFDSGSTLPAGWTATSSRVGISSQVANGTYPIPSNGKATKINNLIMESCLPAGEQVRLNIDGVVNTTGKTGIFVGFGRRRTTVFTSPVALEYSVDGTTWISISTDVSPATALDWDFVSYSLPADANNQPNLRFRYVYTTSGSSSCSSSAVPNFRIDDFIVGDNIPLPVQLLSFDVKPIGNNVRLSWETASEINSAYFEVQRSTDMSEFIALKRIDATNNSNEKRWYSFEDENLPQGIYYYRLRQVDFDGKATNYKALAVNISDDTPSILTYPNPVSTANNMVYVKMYNINPENVLLINSQGQQISYSLKQDSANTYILTPNTNIAGGIYYLKTMATNQEILISKIVFN